MACTENEKRAHAKWDKEHRSTISANVRKEFKAEVQDFCDRHGISLCYLVKTCLRAVLDMDNGGQM